MTIGSILAKFHELIAFPAERHQPDPSRYERFAIPYSFKPQLSVAEAALAAGGTLLRILLGSLLFAFWGVGTWMTLAAIGNLFLRGVVGVISLILFLVLLAGLLVCISALVKTIWPQRHEP